MSDTLRERLAKLAHEQWSGWMYYLFSKSQANDDGTVTIPKWAVERWKRQVETPYDSLPEDEKESDRKEADKFIAELERENAELKELVARMKLALSAQCVNCEWLHENECGDCRTKKLLEAAERG